MKPWNLSRWTPRMFDPGFRFPAKSGQTDLSRTRSCHVWPFRWSTADPLGCKSVHLPTGLRPDSPDGLPRTVAGTLPGPLAGFLAEQATRLNPQCSFIPQGSFTPQGCLFYKAAYSTRLPRKHAPNPLVFKKSASTI